MRHGTLGLAHWPGLGSAYMLYTLAGYMRHEALGHTHWPRLGSVVLGRWLRFTYELYEGVCRFFSDDVSKTDLRCEFGRLVCFIITVYIVDLVITVMGFILIIIVVLIIVIIVIVSIIIVIIIIIIMVINQLLTSSSLLSSSWILSSSSVSLHIVEWDYLHPFCYFII